MELPPQSSPSSNTPAPQTYGTSTGYGSSPERNTGYGYGSPAPSSDLFSPQRLLSVLRRRWLLVVCLTTLGGGLGFFFYQQLPRKFSTRAQIEMKASADSLTKDLFVGGDNQDYEQKVNSRLVEMHSTVFKAEAESRFHVLLQQDDLYKTTHSSDKKPPISPASYSLQRGTNIINIHTKGEDKHLIRISANAVAETAVEYFREINNSRSNLAVETIDLQLWGVRGDLKKHEASLRRYRGESRLDSLQAEQAEIEQLLKAHTGMLTGISTRLLEAEEVYEVIKDIDFDVKVEIKLPIGLPNREQITQRIQEFQNARLERALLLQRYTKDNPEIIAMDARLENLEQNIREEIEISQVSFKENIDILKQQRETVLMEMKKLQEQNAAIGLKIIEVNHGISVRQTEINIAQRNLAGLLDSIQKARQRAEEDTTVVRIINRAFVPRDPFYPDIKKFLPTGLILGLALGIAIALITDLLEDRIVSISELEQSIASRIIGVIPHMPGHKRADLALISLNKKFGQASEAYAAIRVRLDHIKQARNTSGGQVVMFCSASPSEGKTVSSSNVAVVSARAGQKTLLIDMDLRRPRHSRIFMAAIEESGVNPEDVSLLHHLSEKGPVDLDRLKLSGPVEGLDLMSTLPSTEINPADVLGSPDIHQLVDWARENYDRVIIDTPPIGLISDGLVLAGLADGVVVFCRANQTRKRALRHVLAQFQSVDAPVLGIIVNDFNTDRVVEAGDAHYKYFAEDYRKQY